MQEQLERLGALRAELDEPTTDGLERAQRDLASHEGGAGEVDVDGGLVM